MYPLSCSAQLIINWFHLSGLFLYGAYWQYENRLFNYDWSLWSLLHFAFIFWCIFWFTFFCDICVRSRISEFFLYDKTSKIALLVLKVLCFKDRLCNFFQICILLLFAQLNWQSIMAFPKIQIRAALFSYENNVILLPSCHLDVWLPTSDESRRVQLHLRCQDREGRLLSAPPVSPL